MSSNQMTVLMTMPLARPIGTAQAAAPKLCRSHNFSTTINVGVRTLTGIPASQFPRSAARASAEALAPVYQGKTLAFMFESRYVFEPTACALDTPALQRDYDAAWAGFESATVNK